MDERCVITMGETATRAELGGKAGALSELGGAGLPIPAWVAVTPTAFAVSLHDEQREVLGGGSDAERLAGAVAAVRVSDRVMVELEAALERVGLGGGLLAVRSSATEEDGAGHSFAGQFESYLAVPRERLAERVEAVWRSAFTERVLAYRVERGLEIVPVPPAVLVQGFVEAEASGVAFGADPVSGERGVAVVSAVWGLGTALVGGEASADTWRVDRGGQVLEQELVTKAMRDVPDSGSETGVRSAAVEGAAREEPVLKDARVVEVAELVRRCGRHFGVPQDIEWAVVGGELKLLQSRPITSLRGVLDPAGRRLVWDNANIAESYSGVTTPLTFTFARRAYEGVYREFCLLLRVKRSVVDAEGPTFARMLGLIRGRVYYNLLSWYRVLSLLPGFAVNRGFMEQMMGVREALPEELVQEADASRGVGRLRDGLRLVRVGLALGLEHFRLPGKIRRFYERLEMALAEPEVSLEEQRLDELALSYSRLERALITRWDAPLVNDFLAMIFFGVLRSLSGKWIEKEEGQLHNHLLCAEGGIVSAEPAQRIREMAGLAAGDRGLVDRLCAAPMSEALSAMRGHAALWSAFEAYREKFGDRCLEELKLESMTLLDDPTPLVRSIGFTARRGVEEDHAAGAAEVEEKMRSDAEAEVSVALRWRPVRRVVFGWVLRNARRRVRDRENLRFERTRLFGRVRRICLEMGARLAAEGVLEERRDVFYLELDELMGFVDGTATTADLAGLVRLRRSEFEGYREGAVPADRFETRGALPIGNAFEASKVVDAEEEAGGAGGLRGIGACPGVVRGPVRVVRDPRGIELEPGTIVVAERTDPGWIMLFPAAAGVLVEYGSLLSHSAIVSRELGVPSIVSIQGLTHRLVDGQVVEMDGQRGTVVVLEEGEAGDGHGSK
ncbi:MAG: PEP/pyruvate-binding domain-containing protein [Planctomycetota bacterium]